MSDPIRLLDDPSFSSAPLQHGRNARSLLELGREMAPPSGAKADVWSGLESALGCAAIVGSVAAVTPNAASAGAPIGGGAAKVATSGVPAASQSAALGTKLGLAGLLVGAALIATTVFRQPPTTLLATPPAASGSLRSSTEEPSGESGDPHAVDVYTNRVLATGNAPVAPKEAATDDASDDSKPAEGANHAASNVRAPSSPAPSATADSARDPLDRVSQLRREAELVQAARSELAAGNASAALKTLAQLDQEVPRGAMGQERTVLGIEALKKSGQGAAAAARAAAFLEANPTSPYAERLRPYVN